MVRKLGRGLDSLIEQTRGGRGSREESVECSLILTNPYQPRDNIDEEGIQKLAESIMEHGVLQPVVVRRKDEQYELIAGERRLRASRLAGLERIPVVVRDATNREMLEIALVENLQREDLNPIEKARSYRRYLDELGMTHEEAAKRLGLDRSSITNQLRLLELEDDLQAMVSRGTLRMGHARALLGLAGEERRRLLARRIEAQGLSVREVERIVRQSRDRHAEPAPKGAPRKSPYFEDLERKLRERFSTKAKISGGKKKGRIVLEYYTMDELSRLLEMLLE